MKTKNTKRAAIAIGLGVTLLATTAFADAVLGSGYASLKSSLKTTSKFVGNDVKSYTMEMEYKISEGDRIYQGSKNYVMADIENRKNSSKETNLLNGTESSYYSDNNMNVFTDEDGKKHAIMYNSPRYDDTEYPEPEDLFEQEEVKDFEKVVDAFVGSISDVVSVADTDEGKVYNCTLNASQLPLYINAAASFGIKYTLFDTFNVETYGLPNVKNDICISEASATIITNTDDIITDASGKAKFSGRDENGVVHEFVFEISGKLFDINTTSVETPSLDGVEVSYDSVRYDMGIGKGDVGTYSRPIMEENSDGENVPAGENTLEITAVDENGITGSFTRKYNEGFSGDDEVAFTFNAKFDDMNRDNYYGIPVLYNDGGEEKTAVIARYDNVTYEVSLDVAGEGDGYRVGSNIQMMRVVK